MRTLVVDASVALKWLVLEDMSDVAKELSGTTDILVAPRLACALKHPIYDLIYLEAARRLNAQLVTADRRFTAKIAGTDLARHVTFLSDWRPE